MNRIEGFLEKYMDILRDEHKETILDYYSFLIKFRNVRKQTSIFGNHFVSCPWSSDSATTGPDTCHCYYFLSYSKELEEIMDWYETNLKEK